MHSEGNYTLSPQRTAAPQQVTKPFKPSLFTITTVMDVLLFIECKEIQLGTQRAPFYAFEHEVRKK